MIKYQLVCDAEHEFEGWFGDSAAFETQSKSGLLSCPVCGSEHVRRALMAPNLASPKTRASESDAKAAEATDQTPPAAGPVAGLPPKPARNMQVLVNEMRKLQSKIRSECRDVGDNFAEEARKIHYGETEPEGIYGKATAEEREALDEEGIAVVDMPWLARDN